MGALNQSQAQERTTMPRRILIIDDDVRATQALREALEAEGYSVTVAPDGHLGLVLAQADQPDLVILEITVPGLDGFTICQTLKSDPRYQHIPLMILTGTFTTPADIERGLRLGVGHYAFKTDIYTGQMDLSELLTHVRRLLGDAEQRPYQKSETILIVEDDRLTREILKRSVEAEGYQVLTAGSGEDGLAVFSAHRPDLVMLDINLPGMNGLEVLARMRETEADAAMVIMTAYGSEKTAVSALKYGADDYLSKPFRLWAVTPVIERNLEKSRLRKMARQLIEQLKESNVQLMEQRQKLQEQNIALQEAYTQLQALDTMKENLVAMIVHDLRNPVGIILTALELLRTEMSPYLEPEHRDIIESAMGAAQQLMNLTTNMLEVQKLEEGKMPLQLEPLSLSEAVKRSLAQLRFRLTEKELEVRVELPELPPALGDREVIQRVIGNLLDNAIKFTPVHGQILITGGVENGHVRLSVADNGKGIPEEYWEKVFEKFGQVEERQAGRRSGIGLGLTFCKLAVQAHGGRIWVDHSPLGGSLFSFTLPIAQTEKDNLAPTIPI